MDFDSPDADVEKEFPGLFAESAANRKKDDDECKCFVQVTIFGIFIAMSNKWKIKKNLFLIHIVSDADHEKVSKKELLLLGRRKEKKDKKDRGYATLDGESSPEEDGETK